MAKQLFGTDGIRGVAGEYPLDPQTVYAFGCALGEDAVAHRADPEILIGMDTRESGRWIAEMVAGGLKARGVRVKFAGVITTPGVAYLTKTGDFVAGVMISASHNPYQDNGLKLFGHSGFKLPDEEEHTIEQEILRLRADSVTPAPAALTEDETLPHQYLDFLLSTTTVRFEGVKIALDCGNGAAYRLGPELFRRLGAEVVTICAEPTGRNINLGCGAMHLEALQEAVVAHGADYGVAFDGDADRAIFVTRAGKLVDGDAAMLAAARAMKAAGRLRQNMVVSTVMSNLGLEKLLERDGIRMVRTGVGDKYVLEEMLRRGAVLGGEQSGHVIFREYATTGDGMLTALRVFEIARRANVGLEDLTADLRVYPQKLVNVRIREKQGLLEEPSVAEAIRTAETTLAGTGRVLVRFSGTEPLARVMVEAEDAGMVEHFVNRIADAIRTAEAAKV
ncbi:MAG TPA: phosphoglucosamine mutase [Candidatus Sulfopaludibacter sp.]|nr:phosphoglucosamine mutase [Candidatus Sulfopaludibacter sp.]